MFECERVQYNEEQCGLSKCIYHAYNLLLILMTVGLFSYNFSYGVVYIYQLLVLKCIMCICMCYNNISIQSFNWKVSNCSTPPLTIGSVGVEISEAK